MITINQVKPYTERIFSRSSGPGGQNVNKTSTRVQLTFDILSSDLAEYQKRRLVRKYSNGFIQVVNQETRSQVQNTRLAYENLIALIERGIQAPKIRRVKKAPHLTKGGKAKKMMKDKLKKYRNRRINS
jgi:ribosome-associated protein